MSDDAVGSDDAVVSEAFHARPCRTGDVVTLRATWPSSAEVHALHFARQLTGSQTLLVAWMHGQAGDEAVGSAVIRWQGSDLGELPSTHPGVVEIAHLQVRSDARRQGVGTCLMLEAETLARLREVPWLGLGMGVDNSAAAALYERLGYTRTGVFADSEYDYVDDGGIQRHSIERNEYMITELGPEPR